jgi:hypothetical protein
MNGKQLVGRSAAAGGIGVLCVIVSGIGIAAASNGGSLVIGHANSATSTTTLSNSHGTPLSLKAKHGKPPLTVNSNALIKNLNAAQVGGLTPKQLEARGSSAQLKVNLFVKSPLVIELPPETGVSPKIRLHPLVIVSTAKLAAGTYQVTGTSSGEEAACWLGTAADTVGPHQIGLIGDSGGSTTMTATYKVKKGQRVREYCAGVDASGEQVIVSAGITAISVGTSSAGVASPPNSTTTIRK